MKAAGGWDLRDAALIVASGLAERIKQRELIGQGSTSHIYRVEMEMEMAMALALERRPSFRNQYRVSSRVSS